MRTLYTVWRKMSIRSHFFPSARSERMPCSVPSRATDLANPTTPCLTKLYFRIQHAKNLLLTTKLSISEIAEASGFSGQNFFSKVFRRIVGCPPVYRACRP